MLLTAHHIPGSTSAPESCRGLCSSARLPTALRPAARTPAAASYVQECCSHRQIRRLSPGASPACAASLTTPITATAAARTLAALCFNACGSACAVVSLHRCCPKICRYMQGGRCMQRSQFVLPAGEPGEAQLLRRSASPQRAVRPAPHLQRLPAQELLGGCREASRLPGCRPSPVLPPHCLQQWGPFSHLFMSTVRGMQLVHIQSVQGHLCRTIRPLRL